MPRFKPRGRRGTLPVAVTGRETFAAALTLQRNPMRFQVIIKDLNSAYLSGEPVTAQEAVWFTGGGKALPTQGAGSSFMDEIVLPGYTGELYGVTDPPNSDLYLAELIDDVDRETPHAPPMRMRTTFFPSAVLPVQGPGVAPVKILEADPNGMRRFVMLRSSFAVYLSTSGTPGEIQQLFQYGSDGGAPFMQPIIFGWPYVPRSALFATREAAGSRLWVTEGLGGG